MTTDVETTGDPEATLDRIMRDLDTRDWKLPEDAIRDAHKHRDEIIPRLIQSIEAAAASAASGHVPQGNAHFFALFLLRDFRAKEALPAILDTVSLPGELPLDLFGDAITEGLASVLASLACDTPEVLDRLIRNRSLNEYVRAEAAATYLYLVRDGRLSRERAVEYLQRQLRDAIANSDTEIVDFLVVGLISFAAREAWDDIQEAFRRDLVDELMIDLDYAQESMEKGESQFQEELEHCRPTVSEDTVSSLKSWAAFTEEDDPLPTRVIDEEPLLADRPAEDVWEVPNTIRNTRPSVGRNDPCPCGSGRKYKKCCGAS